MLFRTWRALPVAVAVAVAATTAAVAIASPAQAAGFTTRVVEYIWNAPTYTTSIGSVQCNSNEKVTGGGALVMSLNSNVRLIESFAVSDTKWQWVIHNNTNSVQEIHARAICITNTSGYERRWKRYTPLQPGSLTLVDVSCPAGKTSIAGGFQLHGGLFGNPRKVKASASFFFGNADKGWAFYLRNDDTVTFTGNVQAICISDRVQRWLYDDRFDSVVVPPGQTRVLTDDCSFAPRGYTWSLVGGGWNYVGSDSPHNIVTAALPTDATNDFWKLNLSNPDSKSHEFGLAIVCIAKLRKA